MKITVNGSEKIVEDGIAVSELVAELRCDPSRIAVSVNEDVLEPWKYREIFLNEGDNVEILSFVGGG